MRAQNRLLHLAVTSALVVGTSAAQAAFDPATSYAAPTQPDSSALLDFDGDGDLDIATTTDAPDKIQLLSNAGDGTFVAAGTILLGAGVSAQELAAGDLDGDLDTDLAVALKDSGRVQMLLNQGAGVFTLGSSFVAGNEPRNVALGDLDGDGDLDVVVANKRSDDVTVGLNAGGGVFGSSTSYAAGQEPRFVALGDLDGNGFLDVVVGAHDSRQVSLLYNAGGGVLGAPVALSTGPQLRPEGVDVADLDGDGDLDVVAGTSGTGFNMVSVFLNGGGGFAFGPRVDFPVGGIEPGATRAADFDLDGNVDVVTANKLSNDVSVLLGDGAGSLGVPATFAAGTEPDHLAVGDLDGNGSPEVVATNKLSNDVSVFRNQASGATLALLAPATIGGFTGIQLSSPADAGQVYFCGFSLGSSPGTPLPDGRVFPLNIDALMILASDPGNGVFSNFLNTLDGAGGALVSVNVPNDPSLIGFAFFSAFLTVTPAGGADSISNALPITVQ